MWHNTDEPWKHAKWKKQVTKDNVLFNSMNQISRKNKSIETESREMIAWGEGEECILKTAKFLYGVMKISQD